MAATGSPKTSPHSPRASRECATRPRLQCRMDGPCGGQGAGFDAARLGAHTLKNQGAKWHGDRSSRRPRQKAPTGAVIARLAAECHLENVA